MQYQDVLGYEETKPEIFLNIPDYISYLHYSSYKERIALEIINIYSNSQYFLQYGEW